MYCGTYSIIHTNIVPRHTTKRKTQETGRCPVTDQQLEKDDLISLAPTTTTTLKPRPTPATSIPGLLSLLQNEWDATVLETHQLRKALHTARQELAHALYQHDAATRVIARLLRERDGYRGQLESLQLNQQQNGGGGASKRAISPSAAAGEEGGEATHAGKKARPALGSDVVDVLNATSAELSKLRRKRVISPTVASPDDIREYKLTASYPLHATRKGGILSLATFPTHENGNGFIASAGADTTVAIFDQSSEQTVATLKGHSKKVLDVAFLDSPYALVSSSADTTARVWRRSGEGEGGSDDDAAIACVSVLDDASSEVVAVLVHPTKKYMITAAAEGSWFFYDISRGECVAKVTQDARETTANAGGYTSAALHPDGLILATGGTDAVVNVWESRAQKSVAKFEGHEVDSNGTGITSLSFSENGYYMASAASDGVKLWDLRKLKNFTTLEGVGGGKGTPTQVAFDDSGLYLGVGQCAGAGVKVYGVKQEWSVLKEFTSGFPKKGVHAVAFTRDATSVVVGAADHNLRLFGSGQ